jgi:hypothetical protein
MLGGADNSNGELPSYIIGANTGAGQNWWSHRGLNAMLESCGWKVCQHDEIWKQTTIRAG